MAGLVDGGTLGLLQILRPFAATNLVTNPSFETNTTGWATTTATLTRTAGASVFGAYGGRMLASATNGRSDFALPQATAGQPVTVSIYIKAGSASVFLQLIQDAATVEQAHPGDNAWHRIEVTATAATASTRSLRVIDKRSSAWTNVDIDGAQYEQGVAVATTYIDGDQDGCTWTGTPHAATATRDGRNAQGGQIVSLDSINALVTGMQGIGTPPTNVATQPYALADGEIYQSSTAKARVVHLSLLLIGDGTTAGLHTVRRGLTDLLRPDTRTGRSPLVLRYAGSAVPKRLSVLYEAGLEWQHIAGLTEDVNLRLLAPDPDWRAEPEVASSVALSGSPGGFGMLALRSPQATWSTMTGSAVAVTNVAYTAVRLVDGRILVAGSFNDLGTVAAADHLATWDGTIWAALGSVTPNAAVRAIAISKDNNIVAGGDFTSLNGNANMTRIALWTASSNTWSALGTGGANGAVRSVATEGVVRIWASGSFTSIGGVASTRGIAYWDGAWNDVLTGFPTTFVQAPCLEIGPDGLVYCSVREGVYRWSPITAGWTLIAATNAIDTTVQIKTLNGYLYACGSFTAIGGVNANRIARYNGSTWQPLGGGASAGSITQMTAAPNGDVYVAGNWTSSGGSIGGISTIASIAIWNGSSWLPVPAASLPVTATHANDSYQVWALSDGSFLVGWTAASGTFGTTVGTTGVTTVTNSGSSIAYPIIDLTAVAPIYSLENLTTGARITFNGCSLAAAETASLDLRPGRKTFSSPTRSLLPTILSGSDIAGFNLAPGDNMIAAYAIGGTAVAHWRQRYWTAD